MKSMRPTLYGSSHAVSAGHYLAAAAGFCDPRSGRQRDRCRLRGRHRARRCCIRDEVNVAGVAPIMIRTGRERGKVVTIAGLGHWPEALSRRPVHARARRQDAPGCCAPWCRPRPMPGSPRSGDYGTMSFGEVAARGDPLSPATASPCIRYMATMHRASRTDHRRWPSNAAIFLPGGRSPKVGDRFLQTDLAGTLQYMADEERAAAGARPRGRPAKPRAPPSIAATSRETIVALSRSRRAATSRATTWPSFRCRYEAAGSVRVGATSRSSPAGRGARARCWRRRCAVEAAAGLDGPGAQQRRLHPPAHRVPEGSPSPIASTATAIRCSSTWRWTSCCPTPMSPQRRRRDRPASAPCPDMPPPLGRHPGRPAAARAARLVTAMPTIEPDTSYCCAVDRWGNAFSATPSDGSGRSPVVPGTGHRPSGRGSQSRPDPRHPAGVAPGKRPRLTPNPAIARARRRQRHPVRHAGRRRAGAGDAAGVPERLPLRHGRPGGDRSAALRDLQLPQLLRAVHPPARPADSRTACRRPRSTTCAAAATTSKCCRPSPAAPVRWKPSCSTAAPASCAPAPISVNRPMRW